MSFGNSGHSSIVHSKLKSSEALLERRPLLTLSFNRRSRIFFSCWHHNLFHNPHHSHSLSLSQWKTWHVEFASIKRTCKAWTSECVCARVYVSASHNTTLQRIAWKVMSCWKARVQLKIGGFASHRNSFALLLHIFRRVLFPFQLVTFYSRSC